MEMLVKGEGDRIRLAHGLTEHHLVEILENSEKGRIQYSTGWDSNPNSTFKLISQIHLDKELKKTEFHSRIRLLSQGSEDGDDRSQGRLSPVDADGDIIFEDACDVEFGPSEKPFPEFEEAVTPSTPLFLPNQSPNTFSNISAPRSSPSSSLSQPFKKSDFPGTFLIEARHNTSLIDFGNNHEVSEFRSRSLSLGQTPISSVKRPLLFQRRSYGNRDEEDEANDISDTVALATESPVHSRVKSLLEIDEKNRIVEAEVAAFAKVEACNRFEEEERLKSKKRLELAEKNTMQKLNELTVKEELRYKKLQEIMQELSLKHQKEADLLEKSLAIDEEREAEKKKLIEEEKEVEKKKLEDKELERAAEKLAKEKKALELAKKKHEELQRLAQEKLEAEKKAQEEARRVPPKIGSVNQTNVPAEFKNCILASDLAKYLKSQDLLNRIQKKTSNITNTSKFYNGAIKAVNIPLNQISSQTQSKISHFSNLLEGKHVQVAGLSAPFSITQEASGDLFVTNLLAFRFVKKAEAESSENKLKRENLNYLAIVGVALIKKLPKLGHLIQAHFYKMCPFLVPFNYPKRGMDIRAYSAAIGMNVGDGDKALEATLTQVLLEKLSGYCMLYGYMVKNFSSQQLPSAWSTSDDFLMPREVWKILTTITTLEPQEEVTATVIHRLLEILSDLLLRCYGVQFKKLLSSIRTVYIEKIRRATSKGKSGSVERLDTFLDNLLR